MNNKDEITLHDYFDNLLSKDEQKEFEETLLDNIDLAIDLGKLKNLQRNLRNLPSNFEPNEIVIENIIDSLLGEKDKLEITEEENEQKIKKEKKKKKQKAKKERTGLKAKTKFRLKRLLTFFVFLFFISVIGAGFYFFQKENSTFPWKVSVLSDNASSKLQSIETSGLNSYVNLETFKNDFVKIIIADKGILELSGESNITIVDATQSLNSIKLENGKLIFTPQIGSILFQLSHNNVTIQSKNSQFEIITQNKISAILNILTNFVEIEFDNQFCKIPYNHTFQILDKNNISTPLIRNASKNFTELVRKFDIEKSDKTLEAILKLASKYDAFTLHFMLQIVTPINRELIIEKLIQYFPLPSSITKIDILMLDNAALNTWWEEIYRTM